MVCDGCAWVGARTDVRTTQLIVVIVTADKLSWPIKQFRVGEIFALSNSILV